MQFIPLATRHHLTNHKPDFMLDLWQSHCPKADALFYFDPDITVKCRWTFFEEWVDAGVAVCADVNASMPTNHPIRHAWKTFFKRHGLELRREWDTYYNGGFVGVKKSDLEFLQTWQRIQQLMDPEIGGLQNVNVHDGTFLFHKTDQDALNIATMLSKSLISPVGQDGMEFQTGGGGYIMSHAAGSGKPWKKGMTATLFFERKGAEQRG